jgi:NADPH-dependent curcumin reductase CurA
MSGRENRSVVLAARPRGRPKPADFELVGAPLPDIDDGEFLVRNHYVSLDAGFRNWMNEDSGDAVLPAMALGAPVMGLTLGDVVDSRNADYTQGQLLMARLAWQEYSVGNRDTFVSRLPARPRCPLSYYLGVLGDTGLSAYFGLTEIARPHAGETVVISAAGGAVGSIAGQIAKHLGAHTVAVAGGASKCARLVSELGYDAAVDHRLGSDLPAALAAACPNGIDVYFDNVGGPLLEVVLAQINPGARIVLCGAVASYTAQLPLPGPSNLFQLVTKQATMSGFLTHTRLDRYDAARAVLLDWLERGRIRPVEYRLDGIENVARAFCDLFAGHNFGKTVVRLFAD